MYICEDSFADQLVSMLKKDLFQIGIVKGKKSITAVMPPSLLIPDEMNY